MFLQDNSSRAGCSMAYLTFPWGCMYSLPLLRSIYHYTNPESVSHFAKIWVSLQTTTYKSKNTKYFDVLLLLTCEEVLHAPTAQIWAQNSTISTPNNILIDCRSSINWAHIYCASKFFSAGRVTRIMSSTLLEIMFLSRSQKTLLPRLLVLIWYMIEVSL